MRGIVDKVILLLFGLVLLLTTVPSITPIILLLCVFIALTVDELVSSLPFSYGLFGLGVILSIFFPDILFFLPVLCYPLCVKRPTPVLLASVFPVIRAFFTIDSIATVFLILFLLCVALLLSYRERQLNRTSSDFIKLRDSDRRKTFLTGAGTNLNREPGRGNKNRHPAGANPYCQRNPRQCGTPFIPFHPTGRCYADRKKRR